MEVRTAGEIRMGVERGEGMKGEAEERPDLFVTEATSEWVRKASVEAELRKRDDLLRELEGAIGAIFYIPKDGEERSACGRLLAKVREHLGEVPRG